MPKRPRGDAQINQSLLFVTEWVLGHRRFVWCVAGLSLLLSVAGLTNCSSVMLTFGPIRSKTAVIQEITGRRNREFEAGGLRSMTRGMDSDRDHRHHRNRAIHRPKSPVCQRSTP